MSPTEDPTAEIDVNHARPLAFETSSFVIVAISARTLGAAIAAPIPCSTRAPMSIAGLKASPPTREPTTKTTVPIEKTLALPRLSPSRPPSKMRPPNASV